jgi:hypothetical protein
MTGFSHFYDPLGLSDIILGMHPFGDKLIGKNAIMKILMKKIIMTEKCFFFPLPSDRNY